MIRFNPRYSWSSSLDLIRPRITIAIHFESDGSDIVYLTSHDSTGRPTGGGIQAVDGCIEAFKGATQKVDPLNSTSSIGSIAFKVVDVNGEVSDILQAKHSAGKSPRLQKVEVFFGFGTSLLRRDEVTDPTLPAAIVDFDWVDYELQYTMLMKEYNIGAGYYDFFADDVQRLETPELFIPDISTLRETVDDVQLFIPINENIATNKFQTFDHDTTYSDRPNATVGYIKLEKEVICHSGIVDNVTYGISLAVIERGALNTDAVGHSVDEGQDDDQKTKVEEFFYLEGPALKLLYAVQTGILYGQGGATLPDSWHQGINPSFVRLTDYTNADPMLWNATTNTGRKLAFEGIKKQSGETFINKEILAWLGGFRPVYRDGAIGFKKLTEILSESDYVFELTDDNVSSLGAISYKLSEVINEISINWNWDFRSESFLQTSGIIDAASIAKYQEGKSKTFDFKGVASFNQTGNDLRGVFNALRNRAAGGGYKLQAELMPSVQGLEVGDTVRLTTSKLIDPLTNAPLDRVFEIQQRTPNTKTGRAKLQLFASTEEADEFEVINETQVMNDAFYSSEGTDLDSLPQVSGGVVTGDITLTGGETMGDGIYYHLGDFTLPAAYNIYIDDNVQIRIRGFFTRDGDIIGRGRGHPGGVGGTVFNETGTTNINLEFYPGGVTTYEELMRHIITESTWTETNETSGIQGNGTTAPSRYTRVWGGNDGYYSNRIYRGYVFPSPTLTGRPGGGSASRLTLLNRDGSELEGINDLDLRGSSGSGSKPLFWRFGSGASNYSIIQDGSDGGAGGSGLIIICRGESAGGGSVIDLSGIDGDAAAPITRGVYRSESYIVEADEINICNGGGGGGNPGFYYLLNDGNNTVDSSEVNTDFSRGLSGIDPTSSLYTPKENPVHLGGEWHAIDAIGGTISFGRTITPAVQMGRTAFKVQNIPPPQSLNTGPITSPTYTLPPVTGLALASGTAQLFPAKDGAIRERIRATWDAPAGAQSVQFEVAMREDSNPDYRTVALVTTNEAFIDVTGAVLYYVRVRATSPRENINSSSWVTISHTAIGKTAPPSNPSLFSASFAPEPGILLQVAPHPDADFLEFIIVEDNGTTAAEVYRGNSTSVTLAMRPIGIYTYGITARDRSGNISTGVITDTIEVAPPADPPSFTASVDKEAGVVFAMGAHPGPYFLEYIVTEDDGTTTTEVFRGPGTSATLGFRPIGAYTYEITARDRMGNLSTGTLTDNVTIVRPTTPTWSHETQGCDLVFDLVPSDYSQSYAVAYYRIYNITDAVAWYEGLSTTYRRKFNFSSSKSVRVSAFDIAGNESPTSTDFVSYRQIDNTLAKWSRDHSKLTFELSSSHNSPPSNLLPVSHYTARRKISNTNNEWEDLPDIPGENPTITYDEYALRAFDNYEFFAIDCTGNTADLQAYNGDMGIKAVYAEVFRREEADSSFDGTKVNCAWNTSHLEIEPLGGTSTYTKVMDLGTTYSVGHVEIESDGGTGSDEYSFLVEFSADDVEYFGDIMPVSASGRRGVAASNFRYVRITLTWIDADVAHFSSMESFLTKVSVPDGTESGVIEAVSTDGSGTTVTLRRAWKSVTAIVLTPISSASVRASYTGATGASPTDFEVFLYDSSDTRLTGDVAYTVIGIPDS